jgi:hypothetical protein
MSCDDVVVRDSYELCEACTSCDTYFWEVVLVTNIFPLMLDQSTILECVHIKDRKDKMEELGSELHYR